MASPSGPGAPGHPRIDAVALMLGVGFALLWSSAFTSAKIALSDAPPFLLLTARFVVAGTGAIAIALALGQRLPRTRRVWGLIAVFGFCQNSLYLGLNFLAMTRVPAGLAAIIASALPLVVAALSRVVLGERLPWLGVAGLVAGFAGVVLIMAGRVATGADPFGVLLCLGGVVALAVATLIVRGVSIGDGLLMVVGLQMLVGAVTLLPVGLALETIADIRPTLSLLVSFIYIVTLPGVVATVLWFMLVRRIGATAASTFHFLNPALGVSIAALLLGEAVGWPDFLGVAIVTAGIAAVQVAKAGRAV